MATTTLPRHAPPGPARGLPTVRAAAMMRSDVFAAMRTLTARYGSTWRLRPLLPTLPTFVGTSSVAGLRDTLTDREAFGKDTPGYREIANALGDGLLTSTGERWVVQRRTIQPLFTRRAVDGYAAAFDRATTDTLAGWPTDGTVDLDAAMRELTVRAASSTLFGLDAYEMVAPMLGDVVTMSELVIERAFRPLGTLPVVHAARDRRFEALRTQCAEAIAAIVARRNREVTGTADLVGLLQEATDPETGAPLTAQDVLDQAVVFLLAGHETTSTALTFALWELSRRPALQDAVREEARAVLPSAGEEVDAAAVHRLALTRRVLDEAMRLHPPVPFTARSVERDGTVDGFRVRRGEVVFADFLGAQTDPAHWDDPDVFDPDRFLPAAVKERDAYAYLPFGGGPRACIGNHFALLEATAALGRIVRDRELDGSHSGPVPISVGITMTPSAPVRVGTRTV